MCYKKYLCIYKGMLLYFLHITIFLPKNVLLQSD